MNEVFNKILEEHGKFISDRKSKIYTINEDLAISVEHSDNKVSLVGVNYKRPHAGVNLGTKKFKPLIDSFEKISEETTVKGKEYTFNLTNLEEDLTKIHKFKNENVICNNKKIVNESIPEEDSIKIHKLKSENEKLKKELTNKNIEIEKLKSEIHKLKNESIVRHNERGAGRKARFNSKDIENMQIYRTQGKTIKEISNIFNCSVGLVHKLINKKGHID